MLFSFGFGLLVKAGRRPRIRGLKCVACFRLSKLTFCLWSHLFYVVLFVFGIKGVGYQEASDPRPRIHVVVSGFQS